MENGHYFNGLNLFMHKSYAGYTINGDNMIENAVTTAAICEVLIGWKSHWIIHWLSDAELTKEQRVEVTDFVNRLLDLRSRA